MGLETNFVALLHVAIVIVLLMALLLLRAAMRYVSIPGSRAAARMAE